MSDEQFASAEEIDAGVPDGPKPLVWLVEEEISVGNLQDFADAVVQCHYAGLAIHGPWQFDIMHGSGQPEPCLVERTPTARGTVDPVTDMQNVSLMLDGETASYRLDLRA